MLGTELDGAMHLGLYLPHDEYDVFDECGAYNYKSLIITPTSVADILCESCYTQDCTRGD